MTTVAPDSVPQFPFVNVPAARVITFDAIPEPESVKFADRLLMVVERALEAARLRREVQELKLKAGDEGELVGNSPTVTQLKVLIDKIAPTNSRVLIAGPAGSGKEVAARLIHGRSRRAGNAFVAINCATMEPDRLEAELFGVEIERGPAQDRPVRACA